MTPEVRQALEGARAKLQTNWGTGSLKEVDRLGVTCYCLIGGIAEACGVTVPYQDYTKGGRMMDTDNRPIGYDIYVELYEHPVVMEAVRSLGFYTLDDAWRFNDRAISKTVVLNLFDKVLTKEAA